MEIEPPEKAVAHSKADSKNSKWSLSEAEWLRYEEFKAEAEKRRSRTEKPKPWWQKFLETTGGAALITVLIGGLLGQMISMYIQNNLKDRDMNIQSNLKDRDRRLAAYTKSLDQGTESVKRADALIGACMTASDDLISIAHKDWKPEIHTEQKTGIKAKYNETNRKWREEREQLGRLIGYYHNNDAAIADVWRRVQHSTTDYMDCASDRFTGFQKHVPEASLPECKGKRDAIISTMDELVLRRIEAESKLKVD